MKTIKTYLAVIEPVLLNQITGKSGEFIRLFKQYKPETEEAFKQKICGKKHNDNYYRTLKPRVKKTLQILVIFSTLKGASETKKKLDFCQKNFTASQKFLTAGERTEGLRLIKQAWDLAVEYDFVHLACELSSILYHNHVYYQKNKTKATFYAGQVEKYLDDYVAEKKTEHHFYQVVGQKNDSLQLAAIEKALSQISRYKGSSIKCKIYEATLKVTYQLHHIDYISVIQTCNKTLSAFKNKKGVFSSYYQFLFSKRGLAQMATGHYDDAATSFKKAERHIPAGSRNDYLLRLYKTLNALHSGQYQLAYQLYQQSKRCKFEDIRLQFAIIEAYLCFLSHNGYLELHKIFRLGKYLNETFQAQHDKQGSNVSVLIAELLVHLARNRGKFIDRVAAVKNYSYRYLRGENTRRARNFIKILCLLPRANFSATTLQRIAAPQIQFLEEHPIHLGNNIAIEIIPFGDLLDMVMSQLKQKVA